MNIFFEFMVVHVGSCCASHKCSCEGLAKGSSLQDLLITLKDLIY